jgi:hypothetical protein
MEKNRKTIKYTTALPESSINELKLLAERKIIPSVNFAIREAIHLYIAQTKREVYEKEMREAAKDGDFLKRTLESDEDFSSVDSEVGQGW